MNIYQRDDGAEVFIELPSGALQVYDERGSRGGRFLLPEDATRVPLGEEADTAFWARIADVPMPKKTRAALLAALDLEE